MDTPDPLLLVRRAQLGAALGALGLDGFALEPMFAAYGPELVARMGVGAPGDLSSLWVETDAAGDWGVERLMLLLRDVYASADEVVASAGEVAASLGFPRVRVRVEAVRDATVPRIRFAFTAPPGDAPWTMRSLSTVLSLADVPPDVHRDVERTMGRLRVDGARSFAVVLDRPEAAPSYEIGYGWTFSAERRPEVVGLVDNTVAAMGASERQRAWLGKMIHALAPRPMEDVPLTIGVGPGGVARRLDVGFRHLPANLVLRLLSQLAPTPARAHGPALGALSGALGLTADTVTEVTLRAWDGEPPKMTFALVSDQPPAVGPEA